MPPMNVLFLSNPARGYYRFFNALAKRFEAQGHKACFAVDSPYSAYVNRLEETGAEVFDFSRFFAGFRCDGTVPEAYRGFNLNAMLLADFERGQVFRFWGRKPDGYSDALKGALIAFFSKIFEDKKIDAVVFENIAGAFAHMAWAVCQCTGVRYIGITSTRLPGRFSITDDPLSECAPIERTLREIQDGSVVVDEVVRQWSADYLRDIDNVTPDYMAFNGLDRPGLITGLGHRERIRIWLGALRHVGDRHEYSFGLGSPLRRRFETMRRAMGRRRRIGKLGRFYSQPVAGEKYLLYPLHYHPEASTSILAGTYLNEYEVIRNIAFNLPEGVRLYVKDHRSAYGFPTLDFYEALVRLPNVRLIEPFAPTKVLIRGCEAVVTLTSTVGYEALMIGKRVFLFGNVFYQFHPDVVRITDPSKLFDLFQEWLRRPLRSDAAYNQQFLQAYYLTTYPGVLNLAGKNAADLAASIYPAIAEAVGGRRVVGATSL